MIFPLPKNKNQDKFPSPNKKLLVNFPMIYGEWHPEKNSGLNPLILSFASNKKVWWLCSRGHEWQAKVSNRTINKNRCPYCAGKKTCEDNSLAKKRSDLVEKEWNFSKNRAISPDSVTEFSNKKAWWKCSKGHEWEAVIAKRTHSGRGCPYCSGNKVGYGNSLEDRYPQLIKDWDFKKNSKLPSQYTSGSNKKVWWKCSKGHSWDTPISNRTSNKLEQCPYCSNKRVGKDNNLKYLNLKLAKEWHPTKNDSKTPDQFTLGSNYKAWWLCKKNHEWQAPITSRNRGANCPYCGKVNNGILWKRKASKEFNLTVTNPEICNEWAYDKNAPIRPENVTQGSNKKVFWKCLMGHEWKASIANRAKGRGCAKCTLQLQTSQLERRVFFELKGIFQDAISNDKTLGDEIDIFIPEYNLGIEVDGAYWHSLPGKFEFDSEKNERLAQKNILLFRIRECGLPKISEKDVLCKKSEPPLSIIKKLLSSLEKTSKLKIDHLQKINKYKKTSNFINEYSYFDWISNTNPYPERSLLVKNPELSKEWHPVKNKPYTPNLVLPGSSKKVWWICKEGHEWEATISSRNTGCGCRFCAGQAADKNNNLAITHPEIASKWDFSKNQTLSPENILPGSGKRVWLVCEEHGSYQRIVRDMIRGNGKCPKCSTKRPTVK